MSTQKETGRVNKYLMYLGCIPSAVGILWGYMTLSAIYAFLSLFCPSRLFFWLSPKIYDYGWFWMWNTVCRMYSGVEFHYVGDADKIDPKELAIVISNHKASVDPASICMLAADCGTGAGHLKYVIKKSIVMMPGFGWVRYFTKDLALSRKWSDDEKNIADWSSKFKSRNFRWMMLFPEGTRSGFNEKLSKKKQQSADFCKQRGLPEFKHLLFPRTKGFTAITKTLKNDCEWVYDMTLGYSRPTTFLEWMSGFCRNLAVTVHVKKIKARTLPDEEKDLSDWCIQRFVEKDKLLEYFDKNGHFPNCAPPPRLTARLAAANKKSQ